jgi:hypothetical protein
VLLLQETGRLHQSAIELFARQGYTLSFSLAPGTTSGVALLIQTEFLNKYGCVIDNISPGMMIALRSTRQLALSLSTRTFRRLDLPYAGPSTLLYKTTLENTNNTKPWWVAIKTEPTLPKHDGTRRKATDPPNGGTTVSGKPRCSDK